LLSLTLLKANNCYTFDIDIGVLETVLSAKTYGVGRAAVYSIGSIGYMCNSNDIKNTININVNNFLDNLVFDYLKARKTKK